MVIGIYLDAIVTKPFPMLGNFPIVTETTTSTHQVHYYINHMSVCFPLACELPEAKHIAFYI